MSRRILLADDSVTIQKVIELTFMDDDYEVKPVGNGDEAIALLAPPAAWDFVICDVHMPGANGYEVCRRAKELHPGLPVLLLVGTFEPFDEAQAAACGANSFLKKPFDSQELLQRVHELLGPEEPAAAAGATAAPAAGVAPAAPGLQAAVPAGAGDQPGAEEWHGFELEALEVEAEPEPLDAAAGGPAVAPPLTSWEAFAAPEAHPFTLEEPPEEQALHVEEPPPEAPVGERHFSLEEPAETAAAPADSYVEPQRTTLAGFGDWVPTAEERVGAPLGEAPFASSLAETEAKVAEHAGSSADNGHDIGHAHGHAIDHAIGHDIERSGALGAGALADADIDRIARRVVELMGDKVIRDIAWEVIPDLAEVVIKDRLRELEGQIE